MLFNVPGPIVDEDKQTVLRPSLWKYRYLFVFLSLLGILTIYQLSVVLLLRKSIDLPTSPFQGTKLTNPYQNWKGEGQEKISLHAHSDEVWFTPERHTISEIQSEYKREGFSNVAITDYGQVTEKENSDYIRGFEWGQNIKKRHLLSIGIKKSFYDYFPVYASRENLNWVMDRMKKLGGYVIIPHPKLFDSFSKEEMSSIGGFQAIEVYSPFGDDTKILDTLLSQGRNVHCMASDDLHYFPETSIKSFDQPTWKNIIQTLGNQRGRKGESFLRYIVTAEGKRDQTSVLDSLQSGSFYCVKKFFQGAEDPKVPRIQVNQNNTVELNSKERYLEIRFIGQMGEVLQVNPDTNQASYEFKEKDSYVRLEMIALTGSVLSNAIYRNQ
ncbi:phosphoesterase [Leptospira kanakyensis]|uniref:Phosphoesterase n=1 Tax=Leptospira kanakyensis TaxID=2484968 RepID=A0A6N4Q6W3_9LEPT|nr:phosphoesterase [Leptospira kanakyensis]MCW7481117.1 phosphoesterase [Leptospira kanakyensis]TGK47893.1 phosphoesterase [Leptospira kanakyensis]TGK63099.1 phosphoesterase [Leptospira kanakyensis]TGK66705.1 phosphoesterase [Leptospira kanakyensis]